MSFVLDTNVVSALMKGDAKALNWFEPKRRSDVWLPQPVVAELHFGLASMPGSRRKTLFEERFALLLQELPRVGWDDAVSRAFGRIKAQLEKKGQPLEDFDIAIAAHALAHDVVLATRDRRHMPRIVGLKWEVLA